MRQTANRSTDSFNSRTGATRLAFMIFTVVCCVAGFIALTAIGHAEDPPSTETVPSDVDFNADEVKDQIVTDSTSDEQPGTVEIRSGDSGSTMLRMSGRALVALSR